MIQFPETVAKEWAGVSHIAKARESVKKRIDRGTRIETTVENLRVSHEAKLIFQQELDADQTPVLEMATLASFTPAMAPADLVDGVMKRDGLCLVLGPSTSGKSTLALQLLHSLMTGTDWLGQPVTQINGGVGIMSYDMDAAMVLDWMQGFPNIDPHKVSIVNAYKRGNPLGVPAMRSQIANAWKQMGVKVVVIDSFSASFFGHDQNDAASTMAHYRDLKLFALTECEAEALIVITHTAPGSPDKARGSTVHHDVADTIVAVNPDAKTKIRKVHMVKYRAARGQKQMEPVMITAPDDVTHLCGVDFGAMSLAGMPLPATAGAAAFALPPPIDEAVAQDLTEFEAEFDQTEQEDEDL